MAIHSPVQEQQVTSAELDALYVEHDFDGILPGCETHVIEDRYYSSGHPSHPETIHKHGKKYRLDGVTVAVVFYYTHANKTVTRHIRMLRVAGVRYSVLRQPPVHPKKG